MALKDGDYIRVETKDYMDDLMRLQSENAKLKAEHKEMLDMLDLLKSDADYHGGCHLYDDIVETINSVKGGNSNE